MKWHRDAFVFTTERQTGDVHSTFVLLQSTYWGHTRPKEIVERILQNSLCFFLLHDSEGEVRDHIGFARVITDYTTTSWVSDVVLDSRYQNKGLGSWMMQCMLKHPEILHTQFALQTGTAQEFYHRLGFRCSDALMSTPVDYLD